MTAIYCRGMPSGPICSTLTVSAARGALIIITVRASSWIEICHLVACQSGGDGPKKTTKKPGPAHAGQAELQGGFNSKQQTAYAANCCNRISCKNFVCTTGVSRCVSFFWWPLDANLGLGG